VGLEILFQCAPAPISNRAPFLKTPLSLIVMFIRSRIFLAMSGNIQK